MRSRRIRVVAIMAPVVALLAAMQFFLIQPSSAATAPVKIMELGDSITGSPGCWRALLWQQLENAGYTNIDMVGTQPAQGCGFTYDGENEGHGGALATTTASAGSLVTWLAATLPDVVVMHFGTNDVWSNIAPATILAAFSTLVDEMRASNPSMKILVAQIIPMNPTSCTECAQRVIDFNATIPAWAASKTTTASPITVVDQWTGFNDATDTGDGVHPNDAGNVKIAAKWYPALVAALNGTSASTPPSSAPASSAASSPSSAPVSSPASSPASSRASSPASAPASSSSSSASTGTGCSATYQIVNQWSTGFQGGITVTNTGTSAISTWKVTFTFANGQTITQVWSAKSAQSGAIVTITNEAWNGSLAASASTAAGFIASWNGTTNAVPTLTCVAG